MTIHETINNRLTKFIENKRIPNIIFHGENGSGKKTILEKFINKIYDNDKEKIKKYVLHVNCAHGKGIKFIREDLKFFAKSNVNISGDQSFKSIILLNADKLTIDAQSALRRCIELFSHSTRFFIVIDDKYKLLKPILSRFCEIFVPQPLINNKKYNLHSYNIETSESYFKQKNIDSIIKKTKIVSLIDLVICVNNLYDKGFSSLDLIKYIKKNKNFNELEKFEYLVYIEKIKKEFRNEKLLMITILNFIVFRNNLDLENVSFM
jgi:DNA polymerase III delta prime subunit